MSDARERIRDKILADVRKRVDTYWAEVQMNDADCSDSAKRAREELHKWAARDLKFLLDEVGRLRELVGHMVELDKYKQNSFADDIDNLRAELEAAKRDMETMLGTQRVCFACKNIAPCRNSTTGEYSCDPKWRGLCAENGGANGT